MFFPFSDGLCSDLPLPPVFFGFSFSAARSDTARLRPLLPPLISVKSILLVSKSARATLTTTRSPISKRMPLRSPSIRITSGR